MSTPKAVSHTHSFIIGGPVSRLFPLFSPEGEKLWVPDWDYDNVMGTIELYQDYVFMTRNHDYGSTEAVWIVKRYDPESYFVQFYKVEPTDKVGVITVQCKELEPQKTEVLVTYKYIPLSARGEMFISTFTEVAYRKFINKWQTLLERYFDFTHY